MPHFHRITAALSLFLLLTPAPPLAAQTEEDEPAQTPTDLAELLGPAGIESLSRDWYLEVTTSGFHDVIRYRIVQENDQLHFIRSYWNITADRELSEVTRSTFKYSLQGEFIRIDSLTRKKGIYISWSNVLEDGQVHATIAINGEQTHEDVYDLPTSPETIPDHWLPIALAYHIRSGNESWIIQTQTENQDRHAGKTYRGIRVGPQMIEFQGEEVEAHAFRIQMQLTDRRFVPIEVFPEGQEDARAEKEEGPIALVLADGTVVDNGWDYIIGAEPVAVRLLTTDEVCEILGDAIREDEGSGELEFGLSEVSEEE